MLESWRDRGNYLAYPSFRPKLLSAGYVNRAFSLAAFETHAQENRSPNFIVPCLGPEVLCWQDCCVSAVCCIVCVLHNSHLRLCVVQVEAFQLDFWSYCVQACFPYRLVSGVTPLGAWLPLGLQWEVAICAAATWSSACTGACDIRHQDHRLCVGGIRYQVNLHMHAMDVQVLMHLLWRSSRIYRSLVTLHVTSLRFGIDVKVLYSLCYVKWIVFLLGNPE